MTAETVVDMAAAHPGARSDDEYWGPIHGPGGPRIRLAQQVADFVRMVELVDTAVPGFGTRVVSRFIDDCGTVRPGRRPPGWKGPWPPRRDGFDALDLITIGTQLAAAGHEIVDGDLAGTALGGGLRLIDQGAAQLRG